MDTREKNIRKNLHMDSRCWGYMDAVVLFVVLGIVFFGLYSRQNDNSPDRKVWGSCWNQSKGEAGFLTCTFDADVKVGEVLLVDGDHVQVFTPAERSEDILLYEGDHVTFEGGQRYRVTLEGNGFWEIRDTMTGESPSGDSSLIFRAIPVSRRKEINHHLRRTMSIFCIHQDLSRSPIRFCSLV